MQHLMFKNRQIGELISRGLSQRRRATTTDLERALADSRLDREDLQIQLDAAAESAARGRYALARAELRGAMLILDMMEKRCG